MTKHRILAGNTAPWLRTALTRVEDRLADTVAEQIKNIMFDGDAVVLIPLHVACELGWNNTAAADRPRVHGLPVFVYHEIAGVVVVSKWVASLLTERDDASSFIY